MFGPHPKFTFPLVTWPEVTWPAPDGADEESLDGSTKLEANRFDASVRSEPGYFVKEPV